MNPIAAWFMRFIPKTKIMKWVLGILLVLICGLIGVDPKEVQKSFCASDLPVVNLPLVPEVVRPPDVEGEFGK